MKIGIDKIGFATSNYVLKLNDLAAARATDPEKLSKGLLLKELSIAPLTEDIITLGAAAADPILTSEDKEKIDMVIVATESSIDQSKAAAVFIHGLLAIQPLPGVLRLKKPVMVLLQHLTTQNSILKNIQIARSSLLPVILPNMVLILLVNQLRERELLQC